MSLANPLLPNQFLEAQLKLREADPEAAVKHTDQMSLLLQASQSGKSDAPFTLLAPVRDRIKQVCQSIIAAGSDTTGSTLTAFFYYLLRNKGAMDQLLEEVEANAASASDNGIFPLQTVSSGGEDSVSVYSADGHHIQANDMPYLNACIKETLRLHPTVAFSLPRIVPKGGAMIAGQHFPGGVSILFTDHVALGVDDVLIGGCRCQCLANSSTRGDLWRELPSFHS